MSSENEHLRRLDDELAREIQRRQDQLENTVHQNNTILTEIREELFRQGTIVDMHKELLERHRALLEKQTTTLDKHIAQEEMVKPAVDELITIWRGSKLIFPILGSVIAFLLAAWAWGKEHLK